MIRNFVRLHDEFGEHEQADAWRTKLPNAETP